MLVNLLEQDKHQTMKTETMRHTGEVLDDGKGVISYACPSIVLQELIDILGKVTRSHRQDISRVITREDGIVDKEFDMTHVLVMFLVCDSLVGQEGSQVRVGLLVKVQWLLLYVVGIVVVGRIDGPFGVKDETEAVLEYDVLGDDLEGWWDGVFFERNLPQSSKPRSQCSIHSIYRLYQIMTMSQLEF